MIVFNKKILVLFLITIEICSIFLMCKSINNKESILDDVTLKNNNNIKLNNQVAVMLEQNDGTYKESNTTWPTNMVFNAEKSGCINQDGMKIENSITYENGTAIIETDASSYCYLYFDLDKVAPTISAMSLNNGATYTISATVTATFSWSDSDVAYYCLTNTNSSSSCSWNATTGTSVSLSHSLTTGDGTKTVYAYLKDKVGNVSGVASDSIIYDGTLPTVTTTVNNNSTATPTITITSNEAGTYCINTSASSATNCTFTGSISANSSITTSAFTTNGTYYAHVTDVAGNIGNSSATSVVISALAGDFIVSKKPTGLSTTAYDGMYRFSGTTADNYVSIGGVLYRIIGITSAANSTLGLEAGQLKVIKASFVGTYNWHSDNTANKTWLNTAIYTYLQSSSVLGNTSIIPSGWSDKIDSVKWYIGDVNTTTLTNASTILGYEDNSVTSSYSKIGLIHLSDYAHAHVAGGGINCRENDCGSWVVQNGYEWTMSRYGKQSSNYTVWTIRNGSLGRYDQEDQHSFRPVFYLLPSVKVSTNGTGTSTNPFVLQ